MGIDNETLARKTGADGQLIRQCSACGVLITHTSYR